MRFGGFLWQDMWEKEFNTPAQLVLKIKLCLQKKVWFSNKWSLIKGCFS